jgi:integrase
VKRRKAFMTDLLMPMDADPADAMVTTILRRYFDEKQFQGRSLEVAEYHVKRLESYFEGTRVSDLNAGMFNAHAAHWQKRGWAPGTINKARMYLKASLRHAVSNNYLKSTPLVPMLPGTVGKDRWLTHDEIDRLLAAIRQTHLRLFVLLGLYTGARHTAILQLTWDRVDLETGRIDFRVPGMRLTKKRRARTSIPDVLRDELAEAKKAAKGEFVVMYAGKPLKTIQKGFETACERAGIEGVTPHTLKHTFVTWMLRSGAATVWDVAGLTATTADTIERIYGHHVPDDLKTKTNAMVLHAQQTRNEVPTAEEAGG